MPELTPSERYRLDLEDRVETTRRALLAACRAQTFAISGDERIGEADAAVLLGISGSRLKAMRLEGGGPASYRVGVGGARVSYRIAALARWIEVRQEQACNVSESSGQQPAAD